MEIIRGKYEIVKELGHGGMGVVYEAFQPSLERTVAIKMLSQQLAQNEEFVRRFRQEALIIARLDHPSIIRVFDIEECDDTFYIIMEYVEGMSLQRILKKEGRLPIERALDIAIQASGALHYAHGQGIIHRDIKPDNIMVPPGRSIKLMDFGIARMAESTLRTQTGVSLGTPSYMSPEQASGQALDGRTDLYSLGIVLYGMVTGHLPFSGDSPFSVAIKHIQDAPPLPSTYMAEIEKPLENIILKCLEKDREKRFENGQVLYDALVYYRDYQMGKGDAAADEAAGGTMVIGAEEEAPGGTMVVDAAEESRGGTMVVEEAAAREEKKSVPLDERSTEVERSPEKKKKSALPLALGLTAAMFLVALAGGGYWVMTNGIPGFGGSGGDGGGDSPNGGQIASGGNTFDGGPSPPVDRQPTATPEPTVTPAPSPTARPVPAPTKTPSPAATQLSKIDESTLNEIMFLFAKNEFDEAEAQLRPLLESHPDNAKLQSMQALVNAYETWKELGGTFGAIDPVVEGFYEEAIKNDELWPAHLLYATHLLYNRSSTAKDYEKAYACIKIAQQHVPKSDDRLENERDTIDIIKSAIEAKVN